MPHRLADVLRRSPFPGDHRSVGVPEHVGRHFLPYFGLFGDPDDALVDGLPGSRRRHRSALETS